ncbi:hypothetical protein E1952_14970 [Staphylococcus aureus]|nr:hypothetical protein E1952_14970 [Staphylococcus aureus]
MEAYFCKSLKCKEDTVFVDVEHLGLDGATKVLEVQIDHVKLDEVDKKIRAAREQKEQKKKERPDKSRALKKPVFRGFKRGEVIDLT